MLRAAINFLVVGMLAVPACTSTLFQFKFSNNPTVHVPARLMSYLFSLDKAQQLTIDIIYCIICPGPKSFANLTGFKLGVRL